MNQAVTETPATVEFGGLLWQIKPDLRDEIQYSTYQPGIGEFRVYQYPPTDNHCPGEWLWQAKLNGLLHPMPRPSHVEMDCSNIVPTMEEAMQSCLDAKGKFIEQVCMLAQLFGVKSRGDYETGFFEGKKSGMKDAIEAIRRLTT